MRNAIVRASYVVTALLLVVVAGAATASAAMLAEAGATVGVSTTRWSVVATGQNGAAANATTRVTINRDSSDRWAFFDAVNNGTADVSGFTLNFSSFPGSVSSLAVHACVGGSWTRVSRNNYTCSGSASSLGSTSRSSNFTAGVAVPAGGRVAFRLAISGSTNSGTGTVGATVRRSQAPAATTR